MNHLNDDLFAELEQIDYSSARTQVLFEEPISFQVENPIFDYQEVALYRVELFAGVILSDRTRAFKKAIATLEAINPGVDPYVLIDILKYFNNKFKQNKLPDEEIEEMVWSTLEAIKCGSWHWEPSRIVKKIHWNPDCKLSPQEKKSLVMKVVNSVKSNGTCEKIWNLYIEGLTQKQVGEKLGLGNRIISKYWGVKPLSLDEIVRDFNK